MAKSPELTTTKEATRTAIKDDSSKEQAQLSSTTNNEITKNKQFVVATDCAGLETPITVLKKIGREIVHQSFSESCPQARRSIWGNHNPVHLCHDLTDRDNSKMPQVDLYIAGFPCQPFSSAA